jgi:Holliday junction resolvasome RuvABC endonuclease subunit
VTVINTLACDPGFGAFGWAVICYDKNTRKHSVLKAGVIRTKKATKKQHVLATEDRFARLREIADVLKEHCVQYAVRALVFESLSMPVKSGRSQLVNIGLPYGLLAMLAVQRNMPAVMPTPQQIKKALCGRASASKEEVEDSVGRHLCHWSAATNDFRESVIAHTDRSGGECSMIFVPGLSKVPESMRNHAWDAIAGYITALDSDVMRALHA